MPEVKTVVIGPHGSGNRLMARLLGASEDIRVHVNSFPSDFNWPTGWQASDAVSGTWKFRPDLFFIMMREMSPWSQWRENRPGAESLHGALLNWDQAYREIALSVGPEFWTQDNVVMVRYRDFIDYSPQTMAHHYAEQISNRLGFRVLPWRFREAAIDGDAKYHESFMGGIDPADIVGSRPWLWHELVEKVAGIDYLQEPAERRQEHRRRLGRGKGRR